MALFEQRLKQIPRDKSVETESRFTQAHVLVLICLSLLTVTYVLLAPKVWWFSTDDAIYLASAESILARGEYTFNGFKMISSNKKGNEPWKVLT